MAAFGPKLQFLKLRFTTCESTSWPPLLSFPLKRCVLVVHTERYHPLRFHSNLKHYDRVLSLVPFARAACLLHTCCLLACLLAAKLGRSTLDTKNGSKPKTCSTSSVNPNRNPTPLANRNPKPKPNPSRNPNINPET